jgi:uncharacterized protein YkwD
MRLSYRIARTIAAIVALLAFSIASGSAVVGNAQSSAKALEPQSYMPMLQGNGAGSPPGAGLDPNEMPADWLGRVNYYRQAAGVPIVTEDATLNSQCYLHAQYMAERNHLTHNQSAGPYSTPAGQICAENGNAWLGGASLAPYWQVENSIDGWIGSVGHRFWMLYPTTPTFGYGFYTDSDTNRAGAALDVLSTFNSAADAAYPGWPVRYPAPNQGGIPATTFPITLGWRYFGPTPSITATTLRIENGAAIGHTATNALPVGHKGIQIVPNIPLPDNTVFVVTVSGTYDGAPFEYSWRFSTGDMHLSTASVSEVTESVGDPPGMIAD